RPRALGFALQLALPTPGVRPLHSAVPAEGARMRICLFEDRRVDELYPLTPTRPAFDLVCGLTAIEEKHRRYFGAGGVGYAVRPAVADVVRHRHPDAAVNDPV